eukprot:GDKJ01044744.1.p2 GENE.GDKJ01044744.1~~GDKJ01044744.1.p2  ORF type:complete len:109 (-),score=1.07 GDKJ01044744.1:16-342(-)
MWLPITSMATVGGGSYLLLSGLFLGLAAPLFFLPRALVGWLALASRFTEPDLLIRVESSSITSSTSDTEDLEDATLDSSELDPNNSFISFCRRTSALAFDLAIFLSSV